MSTHLHWSIEKNYKCPTCDKDTVLVVAFDQWKIAEGDRETRQREVHEEMDGTLEVGEEISGHYCVECCKLTALSLNT